MHKTCLKFSTRPQRIFWAKIGFLLIVVYPAFGNQHCRHGKTMHTFSLEDQAAPSPLPAHVFKPQQCDINSQFGTTFPDATDITWTNPRNQWNYKSNTEIENIQETKQVGKLNSSRSAICNAWITQYCDRYPTGNKTTALFSFQSDQLRDKKHWLNLKINVKRNETLIQTKLWNGLKPISVW